MSTKDKLPTIDLADLDQVTGGAARTPSASSGDDSQVTALLQGISDSLKELSADDNKGGSSFRELMPFLLLLGSGSRRGGGGPGPFGGPCGCG